MDISRWIDHHAGFTPDKPALRLGDDSLSYARLAGRVAAAARVLVGDFGLRRGDRVAWLGLNSPDQIVLTLAAARAGLILVALNWRLAPPEQGAILADSGARLLIVQAAFADTIRPVLPADGACRLVGADAGGADAGGVAGIPDLGSLIAAATGLPALPDMAAAGRAADPLLLVYTAGTTGRPKGAVLTLEAMLCNALNARDMHAMTADDHVLTVLPLFHVGGLNIQTLPALYCGASVSLLDRFAPGATLAAIAALKPTLTVQVPATLQALCDHPDWPAADLRSLRAIATGSTDVPVALIKAVHARGVPVIQVYGATETAPVAVYQRIADAVPRLGSIGRPGLHTDIRLVDPDGRAVAPGQPGEILVRGGHVARGYWNAPDLTGAAFRDGWFHTGDIAAADADGWLWFRDRIRNVIISGGENIYPAELERILRAVPGVAAAVVVGRADPRWGQVPVAVVVPDSAAAERRLTAATIASAFAGRLARFKHPKDVVLVAALPTNAMGKVVLDDVRRMVDQAAASGRDNRRTPP